MEALYSIIPEDKLRERLSTLSNCLELSVQLLNEHGAPLQRYGRPVAYCALLKEKVFRGSECDKLHLKAGEIAYALGKSYIFSCHASLNHIAFPLVNRRQLLGTIIIGPFLMDAPDSTLITDVSERYNLAAGVCLELYDELQELPVVSPQRVEQISLLTDYIFAPLLSDERLLMQEKQEKLYQQSRINETIQMFKGNQPQATSDYIYQKEKELLSKVKTCSIADAKALLNDLLGFVLFSEGSHASAVKTRALELTTLLSRVAIEGGAPTERVLKLNQAFMEQLQASADDEELCYVLQEIVENFIRMISMPQRENGSAAILRSVEHIAEHFSEPLSIRSLADVLGISPTYFSALFTKQMGIGFHEYLTRVRVDEAKRLLTATDYPINQIAVSVGYADQSSFTKAFKRVTGLTPYQLR